MPNRPGSPAGPGRDAAAVLTGFTGPTPGADDGTGAAAAAADTGGAAGIELADVVEETAGGAAGWCAQPAITHQLNNPPATRATANAPRWRLPTSRVAERRCSHQDLDDSRSVASHALRLRRSRYFGGDVRKPGRNDPSGAARSSSVRNRCTRAASSIFHSRRSRRPIPDGARRNRAPGSRSCSDAALVNGSRSSTHPSASSKDRSALPGVHGRYTPPTPSSGAALSAASWPVIADRRNQSGPGAAAGSAAAVATATAAAVAAAAQPAAAVSAATDHYSRW